MVTRYPVDAVVLTIGITHVCYEYANLISAAYWSVQGQAPWRTHADNAFLLGYRKLRDLLLKENRSTRYGAELPDILATDYLAKGSKCSWALPTWESEWRAEMDGQLAHISFWRDKNWDHREWLPVLEEEMRSAWAEFLSSVDAAHSPKFMAELSRCRSKLGFGTLTL